MSRGWACGGRRCVTHTIRSRANRRDGSIWGSARTPRPLPFSNREPILDIGGGLVLPGLLDGHVYFGKTLRRSKKPRGRLVPSSDLESCSYFAASRCGVKLRDSPRRKKP
jgi:hypothetical protein